MSGSTLVGTIAPPTRAPATKGPSRRIPNQLPNSVESLIACQTRSSGAWRRALFSMRSVFDVMGRLRKQATVGLHESQPAARKNATVRLRIRNRARYATDVALTAPLAANVSLSH